MQFCRGAGHLSRECHHSSPTNGWNTTTAMIAQRRLVTARRAGGVSNARDRGIERAPLVSTRHRRRHGRRPRPVCTLCHNSPLSVVWGSHVFDRQGPASAQTSTVRPTKLSASSCGGVASGYSYTSFPVRTRLPAELQGASAPGLLSGRKVYHDRRDHERDAMTRPRKLPRRNALRATDSGHPRPRLTPGADKSSDMSAFHPLPPSSNCRGMYWKASRQGDGLGRGVWRRIG